MIEKNESGRAQEKSVTSRPPKDGLYKPFSKIFSAYKTEYALSWKWKGMIPRKINTEVATKRKQEMISNNFFSIMTSSNN